MSKFFKTIVFFGLLLIFVDQAAWCQGNLISITPEQIENLGIKLGKLEPASQVPLFSAPAKVTVPPAHEFVVSSTQEGLVVKMNAAVGDKASKNQLLAVLESPGLLTLQGDYLKAVGAMKLASATYNRNTKLHKEGIISGRGEQEAYSAYHASIIEVSQARQLLQLAGMNAADLDKLERTGRLSKTINIKSPVTGRIIERMTTTGSYVGSMAPLYRIANLDQLWLEINIPQEHIGDLKVGDPVHIENTQTEAVIKVLGQNVNPDNQTIPARALIKNPTASIRVGQKVTVQAVQTSAAITYKLPDTAIAHNEGKAYVFIRNPQGFKTTEVNILGKQDNASVISGNFNGDEDLAIDNAVALKANWLGLGGDE